MPFCNYNFFIRIIFISIVLFSFSVKAQTTRAFVNASMFSGDSNYKKNGLKGLEVGLDYFNIDRFSLQLSFSSIFAELKDQNNYDYDNYIMEKLTNKKATALTLGLGVKFSGLRIDREDFVSLYIMPKVNLSKISASANHTFVDYFDSDKSFVRKERATAIQPYFGLEVGLEILTSERYSSITLNGSFAGLNLGKALNKLEYNKVDYKKFYFGLGVSYHFGLRKLNKENQG